MLVVDAISSIEFGDGELRIDFADGDVDRYRVRDSQLEFFTRRSHNPAWYPLTPEEIMQHLVLHTPIATWLQVRLRLMAVDVIRSSQSLEEMRGVESWSRMLSVAWKLRKSMCLRASNQNVKARSTISARTSARVSSIRIGDDLHVQLRASSLPA